MEQGRRKKSPTDSSEVVRRLLSFGFGMSQPTSCSSAAITVSSSA